MPFHADALCLDQERATDFVDLHEQVEVRSGEYPTSNGALYNAPPDERPTTGFLGDLPLYLPKGLECSRRADI